MREIGEGKSVRKSSHNSVHRERINIHIMEREQRSWHKDNNVQPLQFYNLNVNDERKPA